MEKFLSELNSVADVSAGFGTSCLLHWRRGSKRYVQLAMERLNAKTSS